VLRGYLELGLRLGRHLEGLVDCWFGDPALAAAVAAELLTDPSRLAADARRLRARLSHSGLAEHRYQSLDAHLAALECTAERLSGPGGAVPGGGHALNRDRGRRRGHRSLRGRPRGHLGGVARQRVRPHRGALPVIIAHESYAGRHTEHCLKEAGLVVGRDEREHTIALVNTPRTCSAGCCCRRT
jgi:hypothetical protein